MKQSWGLVDAPWRLSYAGCDPLPTTLQHVWVSTDDQDMRSALSELLLSHIMQHRFAQRHHLTYLQGLLLKLL